MMKSSATNEETVVVWDQKVQQYHGGQDWKFLSNFIEDFSVTTNGLGTPRAALEAAKSALMTIEHYPPANQEPALSSLASFLWPTTQTELKGQLLLGNGASELIDLVVRSTSAGAWKPGDTAVQYMEYERSATSHGRTILSAGDKQPAALISIVNPTNPTGDYMTLPVLKEWIAANVPDGATLTVDESMQLWVGPNWRQDSLVSQSQWIADLFKTRKISVYVIHSWTKIWSCTGIRLGSIVCPTREHCEELRRIQVPWSVNTPALAFLHEVVKDQAYLDQTWKITPVWHQYALDQLALLSPKWKCHGYLFLSWIWIDMKSATIAGKAVDLAKAAGVPVRWGAYGYKMDTFVRIAVRPKEKMDILVNAWQKVSS